MTRATDCTAAREQDYLHVLSTLRACKGNKSRAAMELGVSRVTLYRVLRLIERWEEAAGARLAGHDESA